MFLSAALCHDSIRHHDLCRGLYRYRWIVCRWLLHSMVDCRRTETVFRNSDTRSCMSMQRCLSRRYSSRRRNCHHTSRRSHTGNLHSRCSDTFQRFDSRCSRSHHWTHQSTSRRANRRCICRRCCHRCHHSIRHRRTRCGDGIGATCERRTRRSQSRRANRRCSRNCTTPDGRHSSGNQRRLVLRSRSILQIRSERWRPSQLVSRNIPTAFSAS